jgi:hypothetical protein
MNRYIIFVILAAALLAGGCTVDENGIRDPVAEAKAAATRQAAAIQADKESVKIEIDRKSALAEIKLRETQAESEAYKTKLLAEAQAEADKVRLVEQARASVQVSQAFAIALSIVLVLGAAAAAAWAIGLSAANVYNAAAGARYIKIGVESATLLPPPLVIVDGWLLDTRTGERAALRDPAGVNRLKLATTTHTTDLAIMAQSAERIARQKHPAAAQVADQLPTIAASLPMLYTEGVIE